MLGRKQDHFEHKAIDDDFVIVNKYSLTNFAAQDLVFSVNEEEGWMHVEESKDVLDSTSGHPLTFIVKDQNTLKDLLETAEQNPDSYQEIREAMESAANIIYHPSLSSTHVLLIKEKSDMSASAYVRQVPDDEEKQSYLAYINDRVVRDMAHLRNEGKHVLVNLQNAYYAVENGVQRLFTIIVQGVVILCKIAADGTYVIQSVVKDGKNITVSVLNLLHNITGLETLDALGNFTENSLTRVEQVLGLIIKALDVVAEAGTDAVRLQILQELLGPDGNEEGRNLVISNNLFFHTLVALDRHPDKEEKDIMILGAQIVDPLWQEMIKTGQDLRQKLNDEIADASHPLTHVGVAPADTDDYREQRKELQTLCKMANQIAVDLYQLKEGLIEINPDSVNVLHEKINRLEAHARQGEPTLAKTLAKNWGQMVRKALIGLVVIAAVVAVGVFTGGVGLSLAITLTAIGAAVGGTSGLGWGISDASRSYKKDQEQWEGSVQSKATLFAQSAKAAAPDAKTLAQCMMPRVAG